MAVEVTSQFLLPVTAVLLLCGASADTALSTLARFGDGESSLQNLIKFPAGKKNSRYLKSSGFRNGFNFLEFF